VYVTPDTAANVGASFAAVIDTVYVREANSEPSETVIVNTSLAFVVPSLMAEALGVYVYAPEAWFTVSVP
jgi:hypothetical protein